jgi:hypothetical protein
MPKKSNLQNWFSWFTDWVRKFVSILHNPAEQKLLVLSALQSRDSLCVARSIQRNTPGAVATWYITHQHYTNAHIIVALDNIFELRQFLHEPLPTDTVQVTRTHLISVQWLIRVGQNRKQVFKFKGAWLADLQGRTSSVNAKASEVVKYLVMEILNLPGTAGISWESRIDKYNWEEAIVSKCRIIADNHKPYLKRVKGADILGNQNHERR